MKRNRKFNITVLAVLMALFFSACNWGEEETDVEITTEVQVPFINYTVTNTYPHDTNAFTEGLFIHNGIFYESTGGTPDFPQTRSLFGILDTLSGKIKPKVELNKDRFFGEGIVLLNNKIYQLTYKSRIGFIYDATSYKELDQFSIPTNEGWGFTTNGSELIMSSGSNELLFLNPVNMDVVRTLSVTDNGYAIDLLNELEYINGAIYANVFTANTIVKIDEQSGELLGKIDLNSLFHDARSKFPRAIEMNGIAYNKATNKLYVTGKFWPTLYELELNAPL